jgi:hypothetical protein
VQVQLEKAVQQSHLILAIVDLQKDALLLLPPPLHLPNPLRFPLWLIPFGTHSDEQTRQALLIQINNVCIFKSVNLEAAKLFNYVTVRLKSY